MKIEMILAIAATLVAIPTIVVGIMTTKRYKNTMGLFDLLDSDDEVGPEIWVPVLDKSVQKIMSNTLKRTIRNHGTRIPDIKAFQQTLEHINQMKNKSLSKWAEAETRAGFLLKTPGNMGKIYAYALFLKIRGFEFSSKLWLDRMLHFKDEHYLETFKNTVIYSLKELIEHYSQKEEIPQMMEAREKFLETY